MPGHRRNLVRDHSRLAAAQVTGLSAGRRDFLDVLGTGRPPAYRERAAVR